MHSSGHYLQRKTKAGNDPQCPDECVLKAQKRLLKYSDIPVWHKALGFTIRQNNLLSERSHHYLFYTFHDRVNYIYQILNRNRNGIADRFRKALSHCYNAFCKYD